MSKVKYIVTAFSANDEDDHDPALEELREDINSKTGEIIFQLRRQDEKIKDIQRMITKLMKKTDPDWRPTGAANLLFIIQVKNYSLQTS